MAGTRTQMGSFKFSVFPFIFLTTSSVPSGRTQRTAHTKADSSLKFTSCNPFQENKDKSIGQSPKQGTKQETSSVTICYVQVYHIRTLRKFKAFSN